MMEREFSTKLANEFAERFIETKAENFLSEVYGVETDAGESFDIVVTCIREGKLSPAAKLEVAEDLLDRVYCELKRLQTGFAARQWINKYMMREYRK